LRLAFRFFLLLVSLLLLLVACIVAFPILFDSIWHICCMLGIGSFCIRLWFVGLFRIVLLVLVRLGLRVC